MKKRILIVDDEAGPRESLQMILKPYYDIETAEDGNKALEILRNKEIDLVTLDLKMPGPPPDELLKKIKAKNPNIQVIIITGYGSLKNAIDGIRLGACDFIIKPFDIPELANAIKKGLSEKRKKDALGGFLQEVGNIFGVTATLDDVKKGLKEREKKAKL